VKRVVSVSLGSSTRDHAVVVDICGQPFTIERRGTDGDVTRAKELIAGLSGQVDAIGLGGIDLYLIAGKRRYAIRQARALADAARTTPVVDGSGLKNTLERRTILQLNDDPQFRFAGREVLIVSAVDRFGMAEAFVESGAKVVFGDLLFGVGMPIPLRTLRSVEVAAAMFLPLLCRMPISVIYPTGDKQQETISRFSKYFREAEVIAGDYHFIRRNMPDSLEGKTIVTNTTTRQDVEELRKRKARCLVTTTPEFQGRSFGTNVMEGVIVTLAGKAPEDMRPDDYIYWLKQLDWQPRIENLDRE